MRKSPNDIAVTYRQLKDLVESLRRKTVEGKLEGAELVIGCRQILDFWVATGGSSLDGPVVSFTAIESESDHVLAGSQQTAGALGRRFEPGSTEESNEIQDIATFYRTTFREALDGLADHLVQH